MNLAGFHDHIRLLFIATGLPVVMVDGVPYAWLDQLAYLIAAALILIGIHREERESE